MKLFRILIFVAAVTGVMCSAQTTHKVKSLSVEQMVSAKLPALGHRNWIVIADSAYPLQVSPGVETITVTEGQISCVRQVLAALAKTKHVRPNIFLDSELNYVPETEAPGITHYRSDLEQVLKGRPVDRKVHEDIIKMLDDAGKTFKVLLIKTPLTMAYTSVFFQLQCGYWSDDDEQKLREAMKTRSK